MNFKDRLLRAQSGDRQAEQHIPEMYKPLLVKASIINGAFDEDMYQELCLTMIYCIRKFHI